VRDHDDRCAETDDGFPQKSQDFAPARQVERPGRLVREDDLRTARQRPGQRDPLPLAAGELARPVVLPAGETDPLHDLARPGLVRPRAGQALRKQHVVPDRQRIHQVVRLEYEPDSPAPRLGELRLAQPADLLTGQQHPPAVGAVQAGRAVQQRRLARTGRPHDRAESARREGDRRPVQGSYPGAAGVALRHVEDLDDRCCHGHQPRRPRAPPTHGDLGSRW